MFLTFHLKLELDGLIKVALMNSEIRSLPLSRLSRLNDGLELPGDLWGDELSDGHDDYYYENDSDQPIEILTEDGEWQSYSGGDDDDDDWVEDEDESVMDVDEGDVNHVLSDGSDEQEDIILPGAWPTSNGVVEPIPDATPLEAVENDPTLYPDPKIVDISEPPTAETSWKRFDILSSAPPDHAFYKTAPAQPSRQFMSRLAKEYRALGSSLPGVFSSLTSM